MSLPSGYKLLEYIQSSGTQYIDTGFKPNYNTRIVLEAEIVSHQGNGAYFGSRSSSSSTDSVSNSLLILSSNDIRSDYYGSSVKKSTYPIGKQTIDRNKNVTTIGSISIANTASSNSSTVSLFLFGINTAGSMTLPGYIKVYSCQIYDNGTLTRDYIPCQTTTGEIGLWDDVNSVFYGNAGTGTFTAGKVMAVAADLSETMELEYIQSSGTQYVNTGFKPNQNTKVVCRVSGYSKNSNPSTNLFGCRASTSSSDMFSFNIAGSTGYRTDFYNSRVSFDSSLSYDAIIIVTKDKNICKIESEGVSTTVTNTSGDFQSTYSMFVIGENRGGSVHTPPSVKLYSCQIYDNGTIVRDYIAAKLSDGTVGLYDKLNGLLYINAGTGTFTEGPVVITVPSTPLNFILSSSTDTTVTLSWDAVENATGYKLYRNGSLVTILFSTSYTDTIEPFTDYVYTLTAYNENGESNPATLDVFVIIPPVQPKYFNFIGANNSSIWLSWQPVNHADTYKLYRDGTLLHETRDTKYTDTELNVNTQYNYTLVASNSSGDSPKSSILKASTINLDLVYDRMQEDGDKIAQYIQTKFSNLSEEQQAEWLSYHSKGSWNYTDLNRIEYWIGYITELLGLYIENLDDIPKFEANWDKRSNLYVEDVTHIQEVIELLKTKFKLTEFDLETMQRGPNWDYKQANAIERNLKTLYEQFYYMYIWPVCGDATCGGDYL